MGTRQTPSNNAEDGMQLAKAFTASGLLNHRHIKIVNHPVLSLSHTLHMCIRSNIMSDMSKQAPNTQSKGAAAATATTAATPSDPHSASHRRVLWSVDGCWGYVVGLVGKPSTGKSSMPNFPVLDKLH